MGEGEGQDVRGRNDPSELADSDFAGMADLSEGGEGPRTDLLWCRERRCSF